ncbi:MAG TPA: hypothetical protein VLA95_02765 [Gemmatimonadales bacterium]|nr:hypothetical protein [Gemmatimonadales bacterium]
MTPLAAPICRGLLAAAILLLPCGSVTSAVAQGPTLRVASGVTPEGLATGQWLAMIRKRLPDARYDSVAPIRKPLTTEDQAWEALVRSRAGAWEGEIAGVAEAYRPVAPPASVLIVLGNRGAEDAFTHDPTTIGFDLAALQANYGDAGLPENADRMDRFFRHEYTHLMQKAWWAMHPYAMDTPLRYALADIWAEGLGNYRSLSGRWKAIGGRRSEASAARLAELEPRFVARLAALACTTPPRGDALMADLSWGRFDRKWGALTAALWLEEEPGDPGEALRRLVVAGPDGVWDLAERHLPEALRPVLREARLADSLCAGR